jgi:hypothetical protein
LVRSFVVVVAVVVVDVVTVVVVTVVTATAVELVPVYRYLRCKGQLVLVLPMILVKHSPRVLLALAPWAVKY